MMLMKRTMATSMIDDETDDCNDDDGDNGDDTGVDDDDDDSDMHEIILPATIWWTPGEPTEAIWELKKAPAVQRLLDRTSVFGAKRDS